MAASKSIPFKKIIKGHQGLKVGDLANGGKYKVTAIKSVQWNGMMQVEIIGLCKKVEEEKPNKKAGKKVNDKTK